MVAGGVWHLLSPLYWLVASTLLSGILLLSSVVVEDTPPTRERARAIRSLMRSYRAWSFLDTDDMTFESHSPLNVSGHIIILRKARVLLVSTMLVCRRWLVIVCIQIIHVSSWRHRPQKFTKEKSNNNLVIVIRTIHNTYQGSRCWSTIFFRNTKILKLLPRAFDMMWVWIR